MHARPVAGVKQISNVHVKNCALLHALAAEQIQRAGGEVFFAHDFADSSLAVIDESFAELGFRYVDIPLGVALAGVWSYDGTTCIQ